MKNEVKIWLNFAGENLKSSEVLLKSSLFNPCLQNAQQCVEKALKALLIEKEITVKRTHDIFELNLLLIKKGVFVDISEQECDLINTIYLPTKYPLGSALPDFVPDQKICEEILEIAKRVYQDIKNQLSV
jgi:HEPN domain-containing protein